MSRACPKCHYVNPVATGAAGEVSPACGFVYAQQAEDDAMRARRPSKYDSAIRRRNGCNAIA